MKKKVFQMKLKSYRLKNAWVLKNGDPKEDPKHCLVTRIGNEKKIIRGIKFNWKCKNCKM